MMLTTATSLAPSGDNFVLSMWEVVRTKTVHSNPAHTGTKAPQAHT